MKKTYINPELEVVKLQPMQMLAASTLDISNESFTDPNLFDAREFTLDEEEFDFGEEEFESYE